MNLKNNIIRRVIEGEDVKTDKKKKRKFDFFSFHVVKTHNTFAAYRAITFSFFRNKTHKTENNLIFGGHCTPHETHLPPHSITTARVTLLHHPSAIFLQPSTVSLFTFPAHHLSTFFTSIFSLCRLSQHSLHADRNNTNPTAIFFSLPPPLQSTFILPLFFLNLSTVCINT